MSEADALPEADRRDGAPHPRMSRHLAGHRRALDETEAALKGQLHHAWLLTGPEGIGKATFAWHFARRILGGGPDLDRRIEALSEPRIALVRRAWDDKAKRLKTQITVDEIRKLRDFLSMSATDGGRRVVLIDSADEMNTAAANAVLKLLEEPPAGAVFLVISHSPSKLLPTIRSRCRMLRLDPLDGADLSEALTSIGLTLPDRSEAIAALSAGSVGRAVGLLEQDGLRLYDTLIGLFATAPNLDRAAALNLAASVSGRGNEARRDLLLGLIDTALARLARTGAGAPPAQFASSGEAECFARLAPDAAAARVWASLSQTISDRAGHATAVNLDPQGLILDILLKMNETAGQVARP